jgi:hypothetical protein
MEELKRVDFLSTHVLYAQRKHITATELFLSATCSMLCLMHMKRFRHMGTHVHETVYVGLCHYEQLVSAMVSSLSVFLFPQRASRDYSCSRVIAEL